MTYARKDIFSPDESGIFHCISRCVRRSFLCGFDRYCSRSYEHRKKWVKKRLTELLEIFAIECLAYAVMSNHLHSILRNLPDVAGSWPDAEVARRWRLLFPRRRKPDGSAEDPSLQEVQEIIANVQLVAKYRQRFCDISWFNRCLNENIARRANAEEKCTGRFWEGRFKSIRLEGPGAVLACSVYVDLNPIRAGMAKTPIESSFTSIQDRILSITTPTASKGPKLISHSEVTFPDFSQESYIRLVEETGKMLRNGKHKLAPDLVFSLERLRIRPGSWLANAKSQAKLFRRIIGPIESIRQYAAKKQRGWFQGLGAARMIFV